MQILETFGENRLEIVENERSSTVKNDFHRGGIFKKPACKSFRVWTKNEENFEN